jgi:hypothetical protein
MGILNHHNTDPSGHVSKQTNKDIQTNVDFLDVQKIDMNVQKCKVRASKVNSGLMMF